MSTHSEFAVRVPCHGFVHNRTTSGYETVQVKPDPQLFTNRSEAWSLLRAAENRYKDLGMPEIAATIRVVVRTKTVTITRTEWEEEARSV